MEHMLPYFKQLDNKKLKCGMLRNDFLVNKDTSCAKCASCKRQNKNKTSSQGTVLCLHYNYNLHAHKSVCDLSFDV